MTEIARTRKIKKKTATESKHPLYHKTKTNKQEDKLKNSDWVSLKESQSIFFLNFEMDIFNFTDFFFFPKR